MVFVICCDRARSIGDDRVCCLFSGGGTTRHPSGIVLLVMVTVLVYYDDDDCSNHPHFHHQYNTTIIIKRLQCIFSSISCPSGKVRGAVISGNLLDIVVASVTVLAGSKRRTRCGNQQKYNHIRFTVPCTYDPGTTCCSDSTPP